jgi:hypothetical protein
VDVRLAYVYYVRHGYFFLENGYARTRALVNMQLRYKQTNRCVGKNHFVALLRGAFPCA